MGRPTNREQINKKISKAMTKFNDEVIRKLEEAFSWDCTIGEACLYAGIGKSTYHDHVKANPELMERFEELRNNPVLKARQAVIAAFDNDPKLALSYLERKRKAEFALRQELTGSEGVPLTPPTIKIVIEKKPDDLENT